MKYIKTFEELIDISNMTLPDNLLKYLDSNNKLIDISNITLPKLKYLDCSSNKLIDISNTSTLQIYEYDDNFKKTGHKIIINKEDIELFKNNNYLYILYIDDNIVEYYTKEKDREEIEKILELLNACKQYNL